MKLTQAQRNAIKGLNLKRGYHYHNGHLYDLRSNTRDQMGSVLFDMAPIAKEFERVIDESNDMMQRILTVLAIIEDDEVTA